MCVYDYKFYLNVDLRTKRRKEENRLDEILFRTAKEKTEEKEGVTRI